MKEEMKGEKEMPLAASAFLLLGGLTGGALLIWWAVEFHRNNRQQWMVPFGLILVGTPLLVWFSLVASDALRSLEVLLLKPEVEEEEEEVDRDIEK